MPAWSFFADYWESATSWTFGVDRLGRSRAGARGKVKIWKATSLYAEGDVGGFNANSVRRSKSTAKGGRLCENRWTALIGATRCKGGLEFQLSRWFSTQVGWRYLKNDFVKNGFTNKLDLNGPFIQGAINF